MESQLNELLKEKEARIQREKKQERKEIRANRYRRKDRGNNDLDLEKALMKAKLLL